MNEQETPESVEIQIKRIRLGAPGKVWEPWQYRVQEPNEPECTYSTLKNYALDLARRYPTARIGISSSGTGSLNKVGPVGYAESDLVGKVQIAHISDEALGRLIDLVDQERLNIKARNEGK